MRRSCAREASGIEASYEAVLLRRGLALAVDLSPRHATIDEFVVPPDRINACGHCGYAEVGPRRKGKSLGKPLSAHLNTSACLGSPHERHLGGTQHLPSGAG